MLRVFILDFGGSWDKHLALVDFVYNNNFYSSIGMTPMRLCMIDLTVLFPVGTKLGKDICQNLTLSRKLLARF